MKLFLLPTLLSSLIVTVNGAKETVKFTYKTNSNQAYTSSYWQTDPCIDVNYFEMFASDGYTKQTGSKKVTFKSLEGASTFYSNCKSTGATRTEFNFYSTEGVSGLVFTSLANITVMTNVTAFYTKSLCVIQSYEYPDFESGEEIYSYYVCGDPFESDTKTLSIETILKVTTGVDADEYTSVNKGVNRGPGYVVKYESKARCKSALTTKNIVKLNKKALFTIPLDEFSTFGEICKASSGSSERYMFV
jgi:hypothetical protein